MPKKGDDLSKITADNSLIHHGVDAFYSLGNYQTGLRIIIDKDVDTYGEYGEVTGKTTLISLSERYDINIDGEFYVNGECYKVDKTYDGGDSNLQTVSAVKQ